jgi:cytochrome P450
VADVDRLGVEPLRVVGMLFGIPEHFQKLVQEDGDRRLRTERGGNLDNPDGMPDGQVFAEFIDWRVDHPADDLTTELLEAEFEDETGTLRRLHREELLMFMNVVAVAGAETTTRLIGWSGKLLSEHPDQRRRLAADRALLPGVIEEILRYEPPASQPARYVTRDVEYYGQTVPEGSSILTLIDAAKPRPAVRTRCGGLQHRPPTAPASDVRRRGPLLLGHAGPHRRVHRTRRSIDALPRLGR